MKPDINAGPNTGRKDVNVLPINCGITNTTLVHLSWRPHKLNRPNMKSLPPLGRLFAFAVFLPAMVAGSNQLLFDLIRSYPGLRVWLYPWMTISTAVLSWCVGRYLQPAWLCWIVFGWSLALLDLLTVAACIDHRIDEHFGFVLVSVQISLVVLWAILGPIGWQWRLPVLWLRCPS